MSSLKFRLLNYAGRTLSHWIAEPRVLPPVTVSPATSHLELILDASGSMYGDMRDLRVMVEKVLTVQEFHDADMLVSVMSYASKGDMLLTQLHERKLDPGHTIYVGDTGHDEKAAAHAGLPFIAAGWGYGIGEQAVSKAARLIQSAPDLLNVQEIANRSST